MTFPVIVPDEETLLHPVDIPHYLVARKGLYLKKTGLLGTSITPTDFPKSLPTLGKYEKGAFDWTAPKISRNVMGQALSFFRAVFVAEGTEAIILITKNFTTNQYGVFVPYQDNSHSSVDYIYDPADVPEDEQIIGSIHSHCDFSGKHSSIDEGDVKHFDGIHITIGKVNTNHPDFDALVAVNDVMFGFPIGTVAHISNLNRILHPTEWFDFIKDKKDIKKIHFTTLTKEFVDKWAAPTVTVFSNTIYKSILDNILTKSSNTTGYNWASNTRWSTEIYGHVASHWIDHSGKIKKEFVGDALKLALTKLEETFAKRGFIIEWDIYDVNEDSQVNDIDEEERKLLLLPGPFDYGEID